MAKLTLDDISEPRTYEREREDFRRRVIELKKKRRVHVGPFVTLLFENSQTMRFQIQEMARAERIHTDEGIQAELDVYNPLVPDPGNLAATLFLELTSEEELREWLPKLVGIETRVWLVIDAPEGPIRIRCEVDPEHEKQLTREETTASVHYVHFHLTPEQVDAFERFPVAVEVDHPAYTHWADLPPQSKAELLSDLRNGG
ncbi:MAG TPA: DUF3501 family protein [Acidimicrobiales bacterium]|nr:DUF3501 family protein [Acidimicrobiales bacterium]